MKFLWRSVVGKLWMTIIGLVAVVLLILTFLLVQFFDSYFNEQHEENLNKLAAKIAYIFESYGHGLEALHIAQELVEVSETTLTVVVPGTDRVLEISANSDLPHIDEDVLFANDKLQQVFDGDSVMIRDHFPVEEEQGLTTELDVLLMAIPIMADDRPSGAIFLYQTLDAINETSDAAKKIILYAAGSGIVLSTIFAFFLSSRITSPLRHMKAAASKMEQGDFNYRIPIRSDDEIGDLAKAFNDLGKHLNDSIQALSHEKEQLSSILKSMVDGVVTLDINGEIIMMNPPAENMLKTWKFEENGDTPSHPVLPKRLLNIFQLVVETGTDYEQTVSAQGRSWTIAMSPLSDQGKIRGTVAVIRDMTEEMRMDKLRKDFVANVSHELRTPLSMLQGYSEALVDDVVSSKEERQEMAQVIHDESLRMGRLVNDLLDLARMEAGHVSLERIPCQLSPIIQRTVRKFANLAKEQQVELVEQVPETKLAYELDPDRIEEIFTNLIDNAIRHTPANGTVTISLMEHGQGAVISVEDTGDGIPEEDLPFVFERFYKADKARTRGKSGTGIGLAIVKHLVEAHGGHIQVHSKVGEGTTFTVNLDAIQPGQGMEKE